MLQTDFLRPDAMPIRLEQTLFLLMIMESQYASYVLMGQASIPPMSSAISSSKKASKLKEPRRIHHSQMERANERTEP